MSQLFATGGQSIGASTSASVLPVNIQGWFPLGLTGLISLLSKGLSRVFSSTTIQKHQLFGTQPSLWFKGCQSYDKPRQHIKKQRHYFANKYLSGQSYGFSSSHVRMWELGQKEGWVPKNWCFQTVVLEKTLESPLDSKEIKPINPKGNQPWIFIGRSDAEAEAPILWPPDVKNRLIGKDPNSGKDWM